MQEYVTVKGFAQTTQIEQKSKFIASVGPVSTPLMAEEFITEIRKKYGDATHNVPAYIIGKGAAIQKASDDGEPSGSAGAPILEVIKAHNLVDVVVVVTRYFGGVLLGRGGLIRAYGGACKAVLKAAGILRNIPLQAVDLTLEYTLAGKVEHFLRKREIQIANMEYGVDVTFQLLLLPDKTEALKEEITDQVAGALLWEENEQVYMSIEETIS